MAYAARPELAPPPARSLFSGGSLKFFLAGNAIALGVAYLIIMGLQSTAVYFLTVDELQAKGPAAQGQLYRVSGNLVPGTLVRESSGLAIRFDIADPSGGGSALPVVYRGGQVPDIMGDNVEIVAEGKLDSQGTFAANSVLAKCPSRLDNGSPTEEHDYLSPPAGSG